VKLGCGTLKIWKRKRELLDGDFLLFYPKTRFRVGFSVLLEMLLARVVIQQSLQNLRIGGIYVRVFSSSCHSVR
jgi:hypothetical protein